MKVVHEKDETRGKFIALENDNQAGLMKYTCAGKDKLIFDHTEVHSAFKGQGVGKKLVMAGVDYARENNYKIIPLCPYAASVFDRNPEIQDLKFKG